MIRLLTANWGWKLISICAAAVYWLTVANEPDMATVLRAPVQYKNAPRDLEISSDIAGSVRLELYGVSGQLREFSVNTSPIVLDFSNVRVPGERTFNIDSRSIHLPRGVQLVRAVPAQLRFIFEHREQRSVKVQPRFAGELPKGKHFARVEADPPNLVVLGPTSRVDLVESVATDPIDLSKCKSGDIIVTSPFIEEPQVRFLNFQRVRVRVILKN